MNEETRKDIISYCKEIRKTLKLTIINLHQKAFHDENNTRIAIENLDDIIAKCNEFKESLKQIKL